MEHRSRILIVEDREDWQDKLAATLRAAGYDVDQAFMHGQALGKLAHQHFDLVIVDLDLPGTVPQERFRGEYILDQLKTQGVFSIIVTAYSSPEDDRRLLQEYGQSGLWTIIDKLRFREPAFLRAGFLQDVREALHRAAEARRADGMADDQVERLEQTGPS